MTRAIIIFVALLPVAFCASCGSPTANEIYVANYNYVGHVEAYGLVGGDRNLGAITVRWTRPTDSTRLFLEPVYGQMDDPPSQIETIPFLLRDSTWNIGYPGDSVVFPTYDNFDETPDSVTLYFHGVDVGDAYYLRRR